MRTRVKKLATIAAAVIITAVTAAPASAASTTEDQGYALGAAVYAITNPVVPSPTSAPVVIEQVVVEPAADETSVVAEPVVGPKVQEPTVDASPSPEVPTAPIAPTGVFVAPAPTDTKADGGVTAPVVAETPVVTDEAPVAVPTDCVWNGYVLDAFSADCDAQKEAAAASALVNPKLGPSVSFSANDDGTFTVYASGVKISSTSTDFEVDVVHVLEQINRDLATA
jgi:hypothetical protein